MTVKLFCRDIRGRHLFSFDVFFGEEMMDRLIDTDDNWMMQADLACFNF